jgi:hypothetical protein
MSQKTPANPDNLPTVAEALAKNGLTVLPEPATNGEYAEPIGLPSWVAGPSSTPLPAALTVELSSLHEKRDEARQQGDRFDAERAALFRGFLIGSGLSMTAQYDLATGMVTIPDSE